MNIIKEIIYIVFALMFAFLLIKANIVFFTNKITFSSFLICIIKDCCYATILLFAILLAYFNYIGK